MTDLYFRKFNLLHSGLLLPWPLGPLWFGQTGLWSGLYREILLQLDEQGRCFLRNVRILREETEKMIEAKLQNPLLPEQKDMMANFMNAMVLRYISIP
jgi:hypothetical protein